MKQLFFLSITILALSLASCGKDDDGPTTYDAPQWAVKYSDAPMSMTAVIELPDEIKKTQSSDDVLAVFIGTDCRAIADQIKGQFFLNIVGEAEETGVLTIKYYCAKTRYLYQEDGLVSFKADDVLGTADEPYILTLTSL